MIGLRDPESENVALFEGLDSAECYQNINAPRCRGWGGTNPFSHLESVVIKGYGVTSSAYLQDGTPTSSNHMQIKFINESNITGAYFCPRGVGGGYLCDKNYVRSELILTKVGGSNTYKITIHRHPFRVEVQKN
jgi:hypothetical protein